MSITNIGWQSWSSPTKKWHRLPTWDYNPLTSRNRRIKKHSFVQETIKYWCSWYAYGWNITHKKILATLSVIKKHRVPFTHIILDDGWTTWGDWHAPDRTKFPNFAKTIQKIKSDGLEVGLWFAPFLASSKSQLFVQKPDWFVLHKGKPVQGIKLAKLWEPFLPQEYLLDFQKKAVRKYITDFIDHAVKNLGVTLLKLDYLYAPYFNPHLKSDDIPHKQVAWILKYIVTHYPHVHTIASGAPFAPALGRAKSVRISLDTALPPLVPRMINRWVYTQRVKLLIAKLTIQKSLAKYSFDPDVRIFRLDTPSTKKLWQKLEGSIKGVGDNLTQLSKQGLTELKLWFGEESDVNSKQ